METGVKVLDAMTKVPVSVSSDSSIMECAQTMHEQDVGSLLVIDNQKLKGIITEQDIVRRIVAQGESVEGKCAADIMTTQITSVSPSMDIYEAIMTMNKFDIRHTPVMHNGDMIGFITLKDILKIQPDLFDYLLEKIQIRESENKVPPAYGYGRVEPYFE